MLKEINEKEFGLSDMITKGWLVFYRQIKAIAMITLFVHAPIKIIYIVGSVNSGSSVAYIISIFKAFFGMITAMGIIVIVEQAVKNDNVKIGWGEALRKAFSRWGSAIGTIILATLIIFWPLFLVVIPGFAVGRHFFKTNELIFLLATPGFIWLVYYGLYYYFVLIVVTLRQIGGKPALNYSKSLVKGRWWKTLWIITVLILVNVGLDYVIKYGSNYLPARIDIMLDLLAEIANAFSTVVLTIFFLNLDYISEKDRKMG